MRLALVEGGPAQRPPLLRAAARLGRVFYVSAEAPRRVPQALTGHGQLPAVLVLPAAVEPRTRGAVVFEAAGCRGYAPGSTRPAPAPEPPSREPVA
jgi:hypothetical protein